MTSRSLALLTAAAFLLLTAAACAPSRALSPLAQLAVSQPAVAAQLGDRLVFDDRMGTAQIARLASPMEVEGEPVSDYTAGDVAYWPAGHSVVVFLSDGRAVPEGGIVLIGAVANGVEALSGCADDCVVTITGRRSSYSEWGAATEPPASGSSRLD